MKDQLLATLTIGEKKEEIYISGMSKISSEEQLKHLDFCDNLWLAYHTEDKIAYVKHGESWEGGYKLHKVYAVSLGKRYVLEYFGKFSRIINFLKDASSKIKFGFS